MVTGYYGFDEESKPEYGYLIVMEVSERGGFGEGSNSYLAILEKEIYTNKRKAQKQLKVTADKYYGGSNAKLLKIGIV